MTFEEKYKSLNKEQKLAVDTIEGPVMVIAGPGTGKTSILTLRIANILKKTDTPASGILALTFSEAGQKEMKRRLLEMIGSQAREIGVYTFHGFASSIIREFPEHFPHLSRSEQLTEIESQEIIRKIIKENKFKILRPLSNPELYIEPIIHTISASKREAWTPEILKKFAEEKIEEINSDEKYISTRGKSKGGLKADALKEIERLEKTILFSEIYEKYDEEKSKSRKIDYDDLIFELSQALKKDELLLRLIQEKYLYILVDEHQDTNDSQNELIKTIADFFESPNLFIVGDEKQGIYRFQGASIENFLKFKNIWKDMTMIPLKNNYRSHQGILDAVYSMIEKNYEANEMKDLRFPLIGSEDNRKKIDVVYAGNEEAQNEYLSSELKKLQKNHPEETIAIIVKRNRDVEKILSLLNQNGISAASERGIDIFNHGIGQLFFGIIEAVIDQSKIEGLGKSISAGLWNLDFQKKVSLLKAIRAGKNSEIEENLPKLTELRENLNKFDPYSYLINLAEISGLIKLVVNDPISAEVWRAIVGLGNDIMLQKNITNPQDLIEELILYKLTAETKSLKISIGSGDEKIRVMTAHSSKGMEFDYVFLPYALEETWMTSGRKNFFILPNQSASVDEIRDTRRLFYVALTRAKKHISIIAPEVEGLGRELTPLPYILELDKDNIAISNLPESKIIPQSAKRKDSNSEITDYAKNMLEKSGLSVTALSHFIHCPSEFLYKSVLKVPEAPNATLEKGNAMHLAMSNIWAENNRTEDKIGEIIDDTVKDYFSKSYLPSYERENAVEELLSDSPKIAKGLLSHFETAGKVFSEKWADVNYKNIILHGKFDALIDTNDSLNVYDYKTGKVKSLNDIKGETKNSDGDYFRQLIFYKILLENEAKKKPFNASLIFLKPDDSGNIKNISIEINDTDVTRVKSEIDQLIKSVWSGKFLAEKCDDKSCEFCKLKEILN